jgi:hypothetical protein
MTSNEEIVRAMYRTAEGNVQDLEGWRTRRSTASDR